MVSLKLKSMDHINSVRYIYNALEKIAKEELHPKINFHWRARWEEFQNVGNFFTRPDGLDLVEVVMRIEEEFGITVTDNHAESMITVGDTVRYIWKAKRRSSVILDS